MKVVHAQTREPIEPGNVVITLRGDAFRFVRVIPPHGWIKSGRVVCRDEFDNERELFPQVVNLELIP